MQGDPIREPGISEFRIGTLNCRSAFVDNNMICAAQTFGLAVARMCRLFSVSILGLQDTCLSTKAQQEAANKGMQQGGFFGIFGDCTSSAKTGKGVGFCITLAWRANVKDDLAADQHERALTLGIVLFKLFETI